MKKTIIVVMMMSNLMVLQPNAAHANYHEANKQQTPPTSKKIKRSKQKAMQIAERRSGGRAVAVKLTKDGQSYRVRILLANGTVKHVLVSVYR